jgi:hypothetical protein
MGLGYSTGKYDKVRCLLLPAQSGKTRKVEEEIRELKRLSHISDTHSIDIFISANNRLLVHQTSARLRRSLGSTGLTEDDSSDETSSEITDDDDDFMSDAIIKGNIFSWTHGKTTGISSESLSDKILLGDVEMVLMCANKRRFRYLFEMLERLTKHRIFRREPANIYIWIDEADSSINIWRQFENILDMPAITRVTLVSATFGDVLDKYERLTIVPYETTHPECYRRLADCSQVIVKAESKNASLYVSRVLEKHTKELCIPGKRAFIPGAKTKKSHYEIAEILGESFGFAVILINGERKELRIPGEGIVDLREYLSCSDPEELPAEFNHILAELYDKHELTRFPLAITGYLCIQRGVTFQCAPESGRHNGFVFDFGIIPPISEKKEAYQTMARIFGNTGDFPNYIRPTIYATEKTFDGVKYEEEIAVQLPRIVYKEELISVGSDEFNRVAGVYTSTIPRVVANEEDFSHVVSEFESWEDAKAVFTHLHKPFMDSDGFYLTSTTGRAIKQSYEMIQALCNGKKTAAMPWNNLKNGKSVSRLGVGYRSMDDPTTAVWVVRTLTRIREATPPAHSGSG